MEITLDITPPQLISALQSLSKPHVTTTENAIKAIQVISNGPVG